MAPPQESRTGHWPLFASVSVYLCAVAFMLAVSIARNNGHLVYALDDAYIHMAIAKNFAIHGVWGVTQYAFTSCSSSPLWTLLLSFVYYLSGPQEMTPFFLNVIIGILVLCVAYYILRKYGSESATATGVLIAVVFVTPLPALVFTGMEHVLHVLLSICFLFSVSSALASDEAAVRGWTRSSFLALLMVSTRFEGIFAVLSTSAMLLLRGKPAQALSLSGFGSLPIFLYGAISTAFGWYYLPNPILLKGNAPAFTSLEGVARVLGYGLLHQVGSSPHILLLLVASLLLITRQLGATSNVGSSVSINAIFVATTLLHLQFAGTGWFYRYEAYLVATGLMVIACTAQDFRPICLLTGRNSWKSQLRPLPHSLPHFLLVLVVSFPFGLRAVKSFKEIPQATTNIFDQQYQMGLFLKEYYQEQTVAANDIGAISYLANIGLVDLVGLSTLEVASLRLRGEYNTRAISEMALRQGVKLAIVYEDRLRHLGGLPVEWAKVGEWNLPGGVLVLGGDTVSFFAVAPDEKQKLIAHLRAFSPRLPPQVVQRGLYTNL